MEVKGNFEQVRVRGERGLVMPRHITERVLINNISLYFNSLRCAPCSGTISKLACVM